MDDLKLPSIFCENLFSVELSIHSTVVLILPSFLGQETAKWPNGSGLELLVPTYYFSKWNSRYLAFTANVTQENCEYQFSIGSSWEANPGLQLQWLPISCTMNMAKAWNIREFCNAFGNSIKFMTNIPIIFLCSKRLKPPLN